jgi:hypothetical protein
MSGYDLRLIGVLGLFALGIVALLAAFAVTALKNLAARADARMAGSGVMPSLHDDTRDTARLIDHRQAAWRLRC